MHLNPKQDEARHTIEGPLLIIAGAGSGKTATLTARVEYMIREKNISPRSILMVTFTNKAAREMRERIGKVLGVEVGKSLYKNRGQIPLVGTFHSIGIFILKELLNPEHSLYNEITQHIGLKKDFVIYDESDKISVLKSILKNQLNLDEKEFPSKQVAFYISNAKNHLINAKAYEKEVDSKLKEVVFQAYLKYEENLRQNNAIDFDDILVKTLNILQIPQILETYQEVYRYIMVDEYQDTNMPQYEIVKLLASKYRNLAVVGDDSQSIYSWRGANMHNIIHFKKDYPEALAIKLEQNYRSTKNILAGANKLIGNNQTGIKKELWTENQEGQKIMYIEAPDDKTEASIIASIIKEKNTSEESSLSDNLILYRTNAQSRQVEEALLMKNIAYRVVGGLKFYDRKEIKDLLAYIRVVYNPLDVVSMKRIINTPSRKIGDRSIEILDQYRENFNLPYLQIIDHIDEVEELKGGARNALTLFGEIITDLVKASHQIVVSELIALTIKKIEYEAYLKEGLSEEEYQSKKDNIDELINVASQYNGMEARESLGQFLEEIALVTDMDTHDEKHDCVTLMTIHTSKGLEQKRVFLTGVEDGIFPGFKSSGNPEALEEERRLMYVAMTRAREELYISRAQERFHFGDYVRNPASRFIKEIPSEHMENYDLSNTELGRRDYFENKFFNSMAQNESISYKPKIKVQNNDVSIFVLGDRVEHPKFGNGVIVGLNGETAEIAFSGKRETTKMNIRIAPVRKI